MIQFNSSDLDGILTFLKQTELLKNTFRSGYTSAGNPESVAEHTWRLCLMAMVFEKYFPDVNSEKLIKICIIHDLGEIIGGDIPAPEQHINSGKKSSERADFHQLVSSLPENLRDEFLQIWDEYDQAKTPEAKLAKALDKMETILQHNQGANPPEFDYTFNLNYGKEYMFEHPVIRNLRETLDSETKSNANKNNKS